MLNKILLIGRMGADPEVRNLENGNSVANFTLATTESYKDKTTGEKKSTTEWHRIVLWKNLADIAAKYLHKGDLVYIEGKITTRSWEKDGAKHYMTEIVGSNLQMLGQKGASGQQSEKPQSSPEEYPTDDDSSLPF